MNTSSMMNMSDIFSQLKQQYQIHEQSWKTGQTIFNGKSQRII